VIRLEYHARDALATRVELIRAESCANSSYPPRMEDSGPTATAPELSVVIPTLNGEAYLAAQLEAISHQECATDWEVVVADNASTDATVEVASSFRNALPQLRVIRASPRGKSHALNAGIAAASGELIVCLDHDDVVAPGYLEAMRRSLTSTDLAGGRLEHRLLNPSWVIVSETQAASLPGVPGVPPLPFSSGSALAFRRTVHERLAGFAADVGTADDVDFCWRAQVAGFSFAFVQDAVVHHRHRLGLDATFRQGVSYGRGSARVRQKHDPGAVPWGDYWWRVRAISNHAFHASDQWCRYRLVHLTGFVLGALSVEGRLLGPRHWRAARRRPRAWVPSE
jgi:glycosyltransferase involved in cell wall biosynthesis